MSLLAKSFKDMKSNKIDFRMDLLKHLFSFSSEFLRNTLIYILYINCISVDRQQDMNFVSKVSW